MPRRGATGTFDITASWDALRGSGRSQRAAPEQSATTPPRLRLAGAPDTRRPSKEPHQQASPIKRQDDPRWVLAVRTAAVLEGSVLRPERRESLLRMGHAFGLSPFDANLIIAIVQDQARRGHAADYCPTAGEAQLAMVPLPRSRSLLSATTARGRAMRAAVIVMSVMTAELLLIWALLG